MVEKERGRESEERLFVTHHHHAMYCVEKPRRAKQAKQSKQSKPKMPPFPLSHDPAVRRLPNRPGQTKERKCGVYLEKKGVELEKRTEKERKSSRKKKEKKSERRHQNPRSIPKSCLPVLCTLFTAPRTPTNQRRRAKRERKRLAPKKRVEQPTKGNPTNNLRVVSARLRNKRGTSKSFPL